MKFKDLFITRDVSDLVEETQSEGESLQKSIGAFGLTALGVGAIIGTGIFVVIGEGAALAGPSLVLAFVLAAVTCVFSALSYAELSSSVPVSGSAYTFSYATLGELTAFIIGWDLILEYGVSVAAVAVGWVATSTSSCSRRSTTRCPTPSPSRRRRAGSSTSRPSSSSRSSRCCSRWAPGRVRGPTR
jgi:amino acid permease